MIIGVQVCLNCGKGYWLKEKNGNWQNEDDFLVSDDGKYLVVPFDPGTSSERTSRWRKFWRRSGDFKD